MEKLLISVILLVVLIVGVVFVWLPQYRDFADLRQNIKERKAELQQKEDYFSDLNNLSGKLKEYDSEISKINAALPSLPQTPDLLNSLGKESSKNGLVLEKVTLEKTLPLREDSEIQKTSLSFSVFGSYPAFKNLIEALQNSARLIGIESVSFTSKGESVFSFDVKIKIYSY